VSSKNRAHSIVAMERYRWPTDEGFGAIGK
jgi:hypothetical protein